MDNIFNIMTNLIVFVPIVVIFAILPSITRKDIMFGVTIPKSEWGNEYFTKLKKQYRLWAVLLGVVVFGVNSLCTVYLDEQMATVMMQVLLWSLLVVYFLLYIYFWKKTKRYKEDANWQIDAENIAVADTNTTYKSRSLPLLWFLLYVIIIAVTYISAVKLYDLAPNLIATRYDLQGNPLVYAPKSMRLVYMMVGMQVLMAVLFFGINLIIRRAKKTIDPDNAKRTSRQNDMMKYRWSIFLFITGFLMMLIFAQIIVAMFVQMPVGVSIALPLVITMLIIVYAIVLSVNTGQSGNRIKVNGNETKDGKITRDDDSLWKLGMFYYNKNDPAIFVEKRFGAGWTNNWAKWQSWLIIAAVIGIIVVSMVLGL